MHTQIESKEKDAVKASKSNTIEKTEAPLNMQQEDEKLSKDLSNGGHKIADRGKRVYNERKENAQSSSPRRNKTQNRPNYHNRNNRSNLQQQFVNNSKFDTNNNKQHHQQQQHQQNNTYNGNQHLNYGSKIVGSKIPDNQEINGHSKKQTQYLQKQRVNMKNTRNVNFDQSYSSKTLRIDNSVSSLNSSSASSAGTVAENASILNETSSNSSQQRTNNSSTVNTNSLACGENETFNRKYPTEFLHQIGHQMTNSILTNSSSKNQKSFDDANLMALKMALGDNSGYYNHFYSGMTYGNQIFLQQQQQQQQQYHQNYTRYQQQMQRMRAYPRENAGYRGSYQHNSSQRMYSESDLLTSRHLSLQQLPHDQRLYQTQPYYHQSTPQTTHQQQQSNSLSSYQNRGKPRDHTQNRKNHHHVHHNNNRNQNNSNDRNYKKSVDHSQQYLNSTKSENNVQYSVQEYNNYRKNLMYVRTSSDECNYRSLSPTPPSSVKSASPGLNNKSSSDKISIHTKLNGYTEFGDDCDSTVSSAPSALSYSSDATKELPINPSMSTSTEIKENSVNTWINNNNFIVTQNNGLSASAEQLNMRTIDTPVTIIKRPTSVHTIPVQTQHQQQNNRNNNNHSVPRNFNIAYDPSYPFEYYFARADYLEIRIPPSKLCTGSIWDRSSRQIWEKFQVFQQTRETYRSKMILWRDLYECVKGFPLFHARALPKWGLFLVGSTISGFGLDSSDIDMCLVYKGAPQVPDVRTEAMITLNNLKEYLIKTGSPFQGFALINAKVPILRFRDLTNTIEVDLNYNNCIGVRNTHLMYCYAQLDWRMRPLVIAVKLWAQFHNINDARNSTISSYSLVLMVIHFLQSAISPSVLPCLHNMYPEKFKVLHDITTIDMMEQLSIEWHSENTLSIGELFSKFLDYYSNFDYANNAISIRTGGVLSIEECRNVKTSKNDPNHWQTLCIEEPFDLTNTARSTYDGEIFEKIKNVFFQSWLMLKETKSFDSLFREPLFMQQQVQTAVFHQTQLMSDIKYIMYTPSSPIHSPLISPATNSEVVS